MIKIYQIFVYHDHNLAPSIEDYIFNSKIYINSEDQDRIFKALNVTDYDDFYDLYREYGVIEHAYIDVLEGDSKAFCIKFIGYGENTYLGLIRDRDGYRVCGLCFRANEAHEMIPLECDKTHEFDDFFNDLAYPFLRLKDYTMITKEKAYLIINKDAIYNEDKDILKEFLAIKLYQNKNSLIDINSIAIDITDVFSPELIQIDYLAKGNKKIYTFNNHNPISSYKLVKSLKENTELIENAIDSVICDVNELIFDEVHKEENQKRIDYAYNLSMELVNSFNLKTEEDNPFAGFYSELDIKIFEIYDDSIDTLEDLKNIDSFISFSYYEDEQIKNQIKKIINKLPDANEIGLLRSSLNASFDKIFKNRQYIKSSNAIINSIKSLKLNNEKANSLISLYTSVIKRINLINYDRINKIEELINEFNLFPSEENLDKIFDMEFNLTADEHSLVNERLKDLEIYINDDIKAPATINNDIRRVFIKKSLAKELLSLDRGVRASINEIVRELKCLSGLALNQYLSSLRANSPYDRVNHKVRIKNPRNLPYRFCFWFGKDFTDREYTKNDIYIYHLIIDHDNDIKKMKELTPNKYEENDFILYSFDVNRNDYDINLPELRCNQLKLSSLSLGPSVIYGCAGSGKTLVSVDQYFQIVKAMDKYNEESIAYVTYQELLRKNALDYITAYGVKPYCYTINEYFLHSLRNESEINISNENTFLAWFNDYYIKNGHLFNRRGEISHIISAPSVDRICYTYYRGIFKGSKILYDTLDYNNPRYTLSSKEFKLELSKEEFLSKDEIDDIYIVCKSYYAYARENNMIDDNDLAIEVLLKGRGNTLKRALNIIVDEVQDLTSLQLHSLILTLGRGSTNIFFYGDPHQTINPTIFDDSILRTSVKDILGNNIDLDEGNSLMGIHRTNENLKLYLEHLQDLRIKWLGSYMDNYARITNVKNNLSEADALALEEEANDRSNCRWASLLTKDSLKPNALKRAILGGAAIIVPSEAVREDLISKYKINKERIFTIYEAKGMEWNKVILYNMITNSKEYFKMMIHNEGKKSTICRMFFNKFYVACTRARDTFIIIEDDIDAELTNALFDNVVRIDAEEQINIYFDAEASFNDWILEAKRFINNNEFNRAAYPLAMAKFSAKGKTEINLVNRLIRRKRSSKSDDTELLEFANDYFKNEDYKEAMFYYSLLKMWDWFNLCKLILDEEISKPEYLEELINSSCFKENKWSHIHLNKQRYFKNIIERLLNRIKGRI